MSRPIISPSRLRIVKFSSGILGQDQFNPLISQEKIAKPPVLQRSSNGSGSGGDSEETISSPSYTATNPSGTSGSSGTTSTGTTGSTSVIASTRSTLTESVTISSKSPSPINEPLTSGSKTATDLTSDDAGPSANYSTQVQVVPHEYVYEQEQVTDTAGPSHSGQTGRYSTNTSQQHPHHALLRTYEQDSSGNRRSRLSDVAEEDEENESVIQQYESNDDASTTNMAHDSDIEEEMDLEEINAMIRRKARATRAKHMRKERMADMRRLISFPEREFSLLVKRVFTKVRPNQEFRIARTAMKKLNEACELFITQLCEAATLGTRHGKRVTLFNTDFRLVLQVLKFMTSDTMWNQLNEWNISLDMPIMEGVRLGPQACLAESANFSRLF